MFITFDVSPGAGGPGILLGFTDARRFDRLEPAERREQVLGGFAALFGEEALRPIDFTDQRWGREFRARRPHRSGAARSWTQFGPLLRKLVGPLHWAGTETADEWTGFMDGAVRLQRAAAEVAAALRG